MCVYMSGLRNTYILKSTQRIFQNGSVPLSLSISSNIFPPYPSLISIFFPSYYLSALRTSAILRLIVTSIYVIYNINILVSVRPRVIAVALN